MKTLILILRVALLSCLIRIERSLQGYCNFQFHSDDGDFAVSAFPADWMQRDIFLYFTA